AGDDATVKTVDAIMRTVLRQSLPEKKKPLAGTLVHYAFGGVMGALYGGLAEVVPRAAAGFGLPFGAAVWLGAHVITVPALGLAEPPPSQPHHGTPASVAADGHDDRPIRATAARIRTPREELTITAGNASPNASLRRVLAPTCTVIRAPTRNATASESEVVMEPPETSHEQRQRLLHQLGERAQELRSSGAVERAVVAGQREDHRR